MAEEKCVCVCVSFTEKAGEVTDRLEFECVMQNQSRYALDYPLPTKQALYSFHIASMML